MAHAPLPAQDDGAAPAPDDGAAFVTIDDAINPFVKRAGEIWQGARHGRCFPARGDLTLRMLAPVLPYAVILSVIDGGADYEFRYVGEAQREALRASFKGVRVSQIEAALPALGALLRGVYEQVRASGMPFVIRGRLPEGSPDTNLMYHESAFFPLGETEAAVDHVMVVGVQVPEPLYRLADDKRVTLVEQVGALPAPA